MRNLLFTAAMLAGGALFTPTPTLAAPTMGPAVSMTESVLPVLAGQAPAASEQATAETVQYRRYHRRYYRSHRRYYRR